MINAKVKSKNKNFILTENFSYKLIALFISFVLWISILGRRDFSATSEVEVNFIAAPAYSVMAQTSDRVKIKVSGPQSLMKKYKDRSHTLNIDVSDKVAGLYEMDMVTGVFDLPPGLKILSIRPNLIKYEIIKK